LLPYTLNIKKAYWATSKYTGDLHHMSGWKRHYACSTEKFYESEFVDKFLLYASSQKQEAQGPHRSSESYWLIFRLLTHVTLLFFIAIRSHCQ
jgi:hypothetical protein